MNINELIAALDAYLSPSNYIDYAPNGLQVAGKETVQTLCTAVSASLAVIQQAVTCRADVLLVHHGFFWKGESAPIVGMKQRRIKALLAADLNLLAYHLPLDGHLAIGNNAWLAKCFEWDDLQQHNAFQNPALLWSGTLKTPLTPSACLAQLSQYLAHPVQHISSAPEKIRRIAWCTGGAQDLIEQAAHLGVDAYISGEVSERTYYQAKELGVHYFAGGHHATERGGVRALGEYLAERFGLAHQFIDVDNPF